MKRAEAGEAYDQLIGEGNEKGNAIVQAAIDALVAQTKEFERAIAALDLKAIEFEGSDSLDSPDKVKKQKQSSANVRGCQNERWTGAACSRAFVRHR